MIRWYIAAVLLWIGCAGVCAAAEFEYPDVYKVPRALGMGNAGVAVGDHADALLTNPAGLAGVAEGWRLAPLNVAFASSKRTERFASRLIDALDIDDLTRQREALIEALRRYRGRNLHGEAAALPTVTWRQGRLALGIAWLGAVKADGRSHQGFGDDGLLDIDARLLFGLVAGFAYSTERLRVGATLKRFHRDRLDREYSVRELVELTEAGRSISDDHVSGHDVGVDLGLQYALAPEAPWQPRFGLAVQNVGGMDFGEAGVFRPTVTAGVAFQPPTARIARLVFSVEYFDLLHRLPQDGDRVKRLRAGAEWTLWDRDRGRSLFALRAGVYQGAATAGAEWRLRGWTLGVNSYAEEQGAYAGQDPDRRYVLSMRFAL